MPVLSSCLTTNGYADTRVHKKSCLTNGYDFKRDFTPLLKYINTKPVLTAIKNPQANAMVERGNQVILHMLDTKYLDKKVPYRSMV